MAVRPWTARLRRRAPSVLSALLGSVAKALAVVSSAGCAHLLVVAAASATPAPPAPGVPLTPDEQRSWADLVARLAA